MGMFLQMSFILCLVWSLGASAKVEWKVVPMEENNRFALQNLKDKNLRHEIQSQGSPPRYFGTHRVKKRNMALLIYFSGSAGTSEVVNIYRALAYNTKSKKFYGDFPFRVESANPGKRWPDTVFTFEKEHFTVQDANTEYKKTITY